VLLTAALVEYGSEPESPVTTATPDGDGWRIDGAKGSVPGAASAELIVVPAKVGDGVGLFLVPANANGITRERQETMNHEPIFELKLDGVKVGADALIGTPEQGSEILAYTLN